MGFGQDSPNSSRAVTPPSQLRIEFASPFVRSSLRRIRNHERSIAESSQVGEITQLAGGLNSCDLESDLSVLNNSGFTRKELDEHYDSLKLIPKTPKARRAYLRHDDSLDFSRRPYEISELTQEEVDELKDSLIPKESREGPKPNFVEGFLRPKRPCEDPERDVSDVSFKPKKSREDPERDVLEDSPGSKILPVNHSRSYIEIFLGISNVERVISSPVISTGNENMNILDESIPSLPELDV